MSRSGGGLGGCHGSRAGGRVVLRTSPGRPLIHLHLICSHFHAAPGPRAATSPLVSIALNRGRWRLICIHPLSFASHFRGTRGWGDWEEAGGHGVTSRPGAGCRDVTREAGCGDVMRWGDVGRWCPPTWAQVGRRLCCAASPASGSAGSAWCPLLRPGCCRLPWPPHAVACPHGPSAATCHAPTAPTAASTAAHTSPSMRSSSPRVNVGCGPAEQRLLLTGLHSVADIFCQSCKTTLGWKYEQAFESSQKYKEGKFIIETSHMVKENGWD
ncbi:protein yippee-like 4 isoform X4 [Cuculus canorus]|uniref:protein yippee-like 4 isoform X4 n=1 Tax=Cuculus canorus TaxID=55661 RepID=UPI0023AA486C|nr:protein yippee-like 4 isoform X4 [Cuculus canorus]